MFIVVEGIDGSGKTTVSKHILEHLNKNGKDAVLGLGLGSGIGSAKRRLLLKTNKNISLDEKQDLLTESLVACSETFVKPNLALGNIVLLDRYTPSFYAYQTTEENSECALENWNNYLSEDAKVVAKPDLIIHCDVNIDISFCRIQERVGIDIMDQYFIRRCSEIKKGYYDFFENTSIPTKVIDANLDLTSVLKQVENIIDNIFPR